MASDDRISSTPKYLIGRVTLLTGLSVDVVRVWERRYGAVTPARSSGGTRLYSDADILRLKRLRQAVDAGHAISQAAKLSETELDDLLASATPTIEVANPYQSLRDRFVDAIRVMDVVRADQELARAAALFPAGELVKQVVAPILQEVGERCSQREFGIAHKNLTLWLVRNTLGSLFRLYPGASNSEAIVLATPIGDRHELWIWLAALLGATQGWRIVCLGAEIPSVEIANAVRLTKARFLVLGVSTERPGIVQDFGAISRLIPVSTRVLIGGTEASRYEEFIISANWILVRDLEELDDRFAR